MKKIYKQQKRHVIYFGNSMFLKHFNLTSLSDNGHANYELTNDLLEAISIDDLSDEIKQLILLRLRLFAPSVIEVKWSIDAQSGPFKNKNAIIELSDGYFIKELKITRQRIVFELTNKIQEAMLYLPKEQVDFMEKFPLIFNQAFFENVSYSFLGIKDKQLPIQDLL